MAQQLFKFEGLNRNGEPVTYENVTMEEAMEFQKQEEEGIRERERNAKLAPVMNREVSNFAKSQGVTQQDLSGNFQPKRFATEEDVANNPKLKVGYQIPDESRMQLPPQDEILSSFDNIKASKEDTSELEGMLNNIPPPRSAVTRGMETGMDVQPQQQQGKGSLTSMLDPLPPETAKKLLLEYHNGLITSSKLYDEIAKSMESIQKIRQAKEMSEFESGIKQEEVTQKEETLQPGRVELEEMKQKGANKRAYIDANARESSGTSADARQKQAALKAAKFSESEKKMIGAVQEGKTLMTNLVNTYKSSGFGGAGQTIGQTVAGIPLVGKFLAKKHKEYQNQKEVVAETWLRAATGAAAPDTEVKRYSSFLPEANDPPSVAQTRLTNFFNKIAAKADGRAAAIRLEGDALSELGMEDFARVKYTQADAIVNLITSSAASIPKIYNDEEVIGQPESEPATQTDTPSDDDIISRYLK